jgi:transposase-like protein
MASGKEAQMKRADEMRSVFARHEESGLSLKAFGEREGISYTTLQYWRRKLSGKKGGRKGSPVPAALAPVRIVPDAPEVERRSSAFDVWLSNGISVEVPTGFDERELRRLVEVLAAC